MLFKHYYHNMMTNLKKNIKKKEKIFQKQFIIINYLNNLIASMYRHKLKQ